MAKKEEKPKTELNHEAFSIAKDPETNLWFLVRIPFDFVTGTVGIPERVSNGDNKTIAQERFRIAAGRMLVK